MRSRLVGTSGSPEPSRWNQCSAYATPRYDRVNCEEWRARSNARAQGDTAFFAHLRTELQIDLTDDQFIDGCNAIFVGEMPGIHRVLSRVQDKLPLYVFSNTNAAHQAYWTVHFADLLAPFQKIYVSNEIGARKPETAAFEAVIADIGIAPHRIENVAGARACGLQAVQVATTADVELALGDITQEHR